MGTIQFSSSIHQVHSRLKDYFSSMAVPQIKPLSPGEVLGCTSPVIEGVDALVFIADGRFHLEVCYHRQQAVYRIGLSSLTRVAAYSQP